MITVDLGGLTLLKSFALIRSYARYYFVGKKSERMTMTGVKRRRRKEWREEVERAKTFMEFETIELLEPPNSVGSGMEEWKSNGVVSEEVVNNDNHRSPTSPPSELLGLRKRNILPTTTTTTEQPQIQQPAIMSQRSSDTITSSNPSSPSSPMRKIHSCLDFQQSNSSSRNHNHTWNTHTIQRVSSTASLPNNDTQDSTIYPKDCPEWQRIVKQDLGMTGDMLVTTMRRLKEARMQATSCPAMDDVTSIQIDSSKETTKQSPSKSHNSDDSTLKFLLSGIIKRNHLGVDDALIADCRSIAERGQHSLSKTSRDVIDSYVEEVERCMDWVAGGPIPLTPGRGEEDKDVKPEVVMTRQLEELEKRYTLVKRMKQNMGHSALMLSGGGGECFVIRIAVYYAEPVCLYEMVGIKPKRT